METEKRIGDFRVNRKVSWGITFPQNLHTGLLIRIAQFCRLCAGFVHSLRFKCRPLPPQPPDAVGKARDRAHLLVGLAIAVANIDEVIRLIRASNDAAAARQALMERDWPAADIGVLLDLIDEPGNVISAEGTVRVTEEQARGILELRLQRLTGLERAKIHYGDARSSARHETMEAAGKVWKIVQASAGVRPPVGGVPASLSRCETKLTRSLA